MKFNVLIFTFLIFQISCLNDSTGGHGSPREQDYVVYNMFSKNCINAEQDSLELGDCFDVHSQNFEFIKVQGTIYNIRNSSSKKCLEVKEDSIEDGAELQWVSCSGSAGQKILLQDSKKDPFFKKIIFTHSAKCLDIIDPKRTEGTKLHQWTCGEWPSQNFLVSTKKTTREKLPKIIWTFWDKGSDKMPGFYKANVAHWAQVLGPDWSIKVVNLIEGDVNYVGNFVEIKDLPTMDWIKSKIGTKDYEKKLNPAVVFSDFVRLELLYQHGGIWIDPSVMLHRDLSEVSMPLEILGDFKIAGFTSLGQATSKLRYADSFENFFIAAFPKSDLLSAWKTNFRKYWDGKKAGMAIEDNPMYDGTEGYVTDVSSYKELSNYLNQHIAFKYTIEKDKNLLKKIFLLGDSGLWDKGAFSLLELGNWQDRKLIELDRESIDRVITEMNGVLISKFPSENSRDLRLKDEQYFFESSNVFGRLNRLRENPYKKQQNYCPVLEFPVIRDVNIKNYEGDLCLTVRSKNDGGTFRMQSCNKDTKQAFENFSLEDSGTQIRSLFSCKCLDLESQSVDNHISVHQWNCGSQKSQQFKILHTQNPSLFKIVSKHSGKCLNAVSTVTQEDCVDGKKSQEFRIEYSSQ